LDLAQMLPFEIGQSVMVEGYQLTIKDYLAAAFD
jgi:hypothetical protein